MPKAKQKAKPTPKASVSKVVTQLKKKKSAAEKELETVISTFLKDMKSKLDQINAVDSMLGQLSESQVTAEDKLKNKLMAKKRETLVATVYELLKDKPMHYSELLGTLDKMGMAVKGKNPEANILSVLSRDERFVRVQRGVYKAG